MDIKHKVTGQVLWSADRLAYTSLHNINLAGADLAGAYMIRAKLIGINLTGADMAGADLALVNLSYADLIGADLEGADLAFVNLTRADLANANLTGVNLTNANLHGANLAHADLTGANLKSADLSRVNLTGARGVVAFGPVGAEGRIGYAIQHADGPMIQLGCFWGTLPETLVAIDDKYGFASTYAAFVTAACACLEG